MKKKQVIVVNRVGLVPFNSKEAYLSHMLCLNGVGRLWFNGKKYELKSGDLVIIRKRELIEKIEADDSFKVKIVYATPGFVEICTPKSNYGIQGQLALFLNPVLNLSLFQQFLCLEHMQLLESRIQQENHHFYQETLINAMQNLILDFFDFHVRIYENQIQSTQAALLMARFLEMLENGDFRAHRDVSYYAETLCVTPKYLSGVAKRISGCTASFWIRRFTILDLSRVLRDKTLSLVEISDLFHFSSQNHLSRYVQQHMGISPSEYRK